MSEGSAETSRRTFLRSATGAAVLGAATGTAASQSGGNATNETGNGTAGGGTGGAPSGEAPPPDYGSWFNNVGNYTGETVDKRGQSTVTVQVGTEGNGGYYAFTPPALHVSPGTTVKFEWTGEGGGHNVVSEGQGPLDSGSAVASAGVNYEYTFEDDGIYKYYCSPHEGNGMKGAIVVGTDYATKDTPAPGGVNDVPDGVKSLAVAASFVTTATLGLAYAFVKYGGSRPSTSE